MGGGAGERVRWVGDPSRSYVVSAPADQDASQLYYSYHIMAGGGGVVASPGRITAVLIHNGGNLYCTVPGEGGIRAGARLLTMRMGY